MLLSEKLVHPKNVTNWIHLSNAWNPGSLLVILLILGKKKNKLVHF